MKVIVLGGGVIGVSCAYFLARAGHEVVLLERREGVALETSFANAGEVSPGYSAPWASPGLLVKALKWMLMRHRPLVLWPRPDPALWLWMGQLLGNCNAEAYGRNKGRMLALAEYSRDCLRALRDETGIAYDERTRGTLQLFRTARQVDDALTDMAVLDQFGVPHALLDRDGCVAREPALARVREKVAGGLWLPGDETGDCYLFTRRLAALAAGLGVEFRHGESIQGLLHEGGRVRGVVTGAGRVCGDAYVVALGCHSPALLRPLGLQLPIYPVKGYSLTLPITDPAGAPESTVMDETHKVAVTRLGDRIRVGGTAELAGFSLALRPARRRTLEHVVRDLFGAGGDLERACFWTGLRPMTPDGTPIIGATPYPNLYLATGHGTLGWTMAAGTGRVLADLMSGREPDIDVAGLALARYRV
ncbi:D-amino acid dehydrogenase [Zoogloea sp.]|uniref:D-amino acid dehydrogenase n=1 Tax=Zoogloea sp. TaxID=49181 RepID=UPI001AD28C14|nr:D-amino acid dehydrogenase [Zoogloea sp.]